MVRYEYKSKLVEGLAKLRQVASAADAPGEAAAGKRRNCVIRSVVQGCGAYLPERIVTNDELAKTMDTSDEWIQQRTGIRQRHIAADGEFTSHLAIKAAQRALAAGRHERPPTST